MPPGPAPAAPHREPPARPSPAPAPDLDIDPDPEQGAPHVVGLLLAAGAGTRMGRPKALVTDPATGEPWLPRGIRTLLAGGCTSVLVVLGAEHDAARALLPQPTEADGTAAAPPSTVSEPSGAASAPPGTASEAAGAAAEPAGAIDVVVAEDWSDGLGASLRSGLVAASERGADAVVVSLVDLPDLDRRAVARILTLPLAATELRQATYAGRPGHPVLIGSAHLAPLIAHLAATSDATPSDRPAHLAAALGTTPAATPGATPAADRGARPYLRAHGVTEIDCSDLGGGDDVDSLPT